MHILHIETGRHLYGGAHQVLLLLKGLAATGVQNTLCAPKGSTIALHAGPYARVVPIPMAGELDPRFPWALWKAIRTHRPQIVHAHSRRGADWWGGILARAAGVQAVVTRRVDNPENARLARVKYGLYERVITISEGISEVLRAEGIGAHKIRCVRSCIDPARFAGPYAKAALLKELGIPEKCLLVGTVAQLIPRKGHRFLLDAAQKVLRTHPDTHFCLFGQGPLFGSLKNLVDHRKMGTHVHFLGFRPDVNRILPCLDLVVHPALMEGLGVCLLEASASGVPIVASPVGGIPEIVQDGVNGLLVNPEDTDRLAEAIAWMLDHPLEARRMGTRGAEIVRRHFSPDAMVLGNMRIYEEVLETSRPGPHKGAKYAG